MTSALRSGISRVEPRHEPQDAGYNSPSCSGGFDITSSWASCLPRNEASYFIARCLSPFTVGLSSSDAADLQLGSKVNLCSVFTATRIVKRQPITSRAKVMNNFTSTLFWVNWALVLTPGISAHAPFSVTTGAPETPLLGLSASRLDLD